jgi:hypothetical protein
MKAGEMNALQPLPEHEYLTVLKLVRVNNLPGSELACYMTRQTDSGRGRHPDDGKGFLSGRAFNISYNLMLCEYCGNLIPRAHCPAKMRQLAERWLQGEHNSLQSFD